MGLHLSQGVDPRLDLWMGQSLALLMDPVLAQLGLGLVADLMVGLEQGQTLRLKVDPLLDQTVDLWMSLDHHLGLEADLLLDPEIVDLSLEMPAMDWKV